MDRKQKLKLELARDRVDSWAKQYARITAERDSIRNSAAAAVSAFRNATFPVTVDGVTYRLLLLNSASLSALNDLARFVQLPPFPKEDEELLHQLEREIPVAVRDVIPLIEPRLGSKRSAADAEDAAEFISDYVSWGLAEGVEATLARITPPAAFAHALREALEPAIGLGGVLRTYGRPELLPAVALTGPLATFSAAQKFPELAKTINSSHDYVVVCSPPGQSAANLVKKIAVSE
jgi:hypothetical protein